MVCYRLSLLLLLLPVLMQGNCQDKNDAHKSKLNLTIASSIATRSNSTNVTSNASGSSNHLKKLFRLKIISDGIMFGESVVGIFANSLLILIVVCDPLKRLRKTRSTVIIVNLALADLLTSWVTVLFAFPSSFSLSVQNVMGILLWLGYSASIFMLLVFTVERYVATLYPLQVKRLVTYQKTLVACVASWAVGVVAANNGFYPKMDQVVMMVAAARIGVLEIAVFLMVFLNVGIIVSLRKHSRDIAGGGHHSKEYTRRQKQLNAVLTILIVMLIVTTMPFLISQQLLYMNNWCRWSSFECFTTSETTRFNIALFPRLFLPFGVLNFVLNPFVYAWRLDDYRASARALLPRRKPNHRGSSLPFANITREAPNT